MNVPLLFGLLCLIVIIVIDQQPLAAAAVSMAKPNCSDTCGNVTIPYPFGIGERCYLNESFAISCNVSSNSTKKPFLTKFNLELLSVNLEDHSIKINHPISSNCPIAGVSQSTDFKGSPFKFSTINTFTVVGCDNGLLNYDVQIMAGCTSTCTGDANSNTNSTGCYGINCCQTSIPQTLENYSIRIRDNRTANCTYAFLVEDNWFPGNFSSPYVISKMKDVPVVMTWAPFYNSRSVLFRSPRYGCLSPKDEGGYYSYACGCGWAYEGNPFIPNGCKVAEACSTCEKQCEQRLGGELYCGRRRSNYKTEIILGSSLGGGLLLLLLCGFCFWLFKIIKKRRIMKLKQKFFKRNGGLLLQQQISSEKDTVEKTIVFNSKELEKATDNFNVNRILGQGGQGTVYKGMLSDGKIVAIKKSKAVDENQLEQFINEVVILSQINHRNIVNLLGCCLETEVPLLVYEFISNGNLFQLIHDKNEDVSLSWKMRVQIAIEVAGALAYLHSSSSIPIYHRDIKSTNILLDEKYRAKVSDFGTSRSIAIEQTHLTTLVHGTFGYLDPEYFQSSQFTEKSDVYSFGVVLVELLTGQKAISSISSEEERSLATRFILYLKEARLFDLLDTRVIEEAEKEEIDVVADIAKRCLNLSGKKRPTMKEVMMELEGIKKSGMPLTVPQNSHGDEVTVIEMKGPMDDALHSTRSFSDYRMRFSEDEDSLLHYTS